MLNFLNLKQKNKYNHTKNIYPPSVYYYTYVQVIPFRDKCVCLRTKQCLDYSYRNSHKGIERIPSEAHRHFKLGLTNENL